MSLLMSSLGKSGWALCCLLLLLYASMVPSPVSSTVHSGFTHSGFWYGGDRAPETQYDSVPYANMTVKINRPYQTGPGNNLVKDPFNSKLLLYAGNTIHRQTFDTQFVLDISYATGIEPERVYVTHVSKGDVHFSWESNNVIVQFIFLERNSSQSRTLLESIDTLTNQIQDPNAKLFHGTNVTVDLDPLYGLVVDTWDISLRLTYAVEIIGGTGVKDKYYLNQGGLGLCDGAGALNYVDYCEFERFFEDDIAKALSISYYRVQIMFIKSAALDSSLVYFRILPEQRTSVEPNVTTCVNELIRQVQDQDSPLYNGNVTIRVDPLWGVSQMGATVRSRPPRFLLKYYEMDDSRLKNRKRMQLVTGYDRCKANHRCNWGVVDLDQNTNDVRYYHRFFDMGNLYETSLFLDFQDWRLGARGFSWTGFIPITAVGKTSMPRVRGDDGFLRGAHFWPFNQRSLGPDVPAFMAERNQGLILDRQLQRYQIDLQDALVDDLKGRIEWNQKNIEWVNMGPELRSRKDVKTNISWVIHDYTRWWTNENKELQELTSSMCTQTRCIITFNTSSLLLTGAINDVGEIVKTKYGTEVAVFTFNSIYLGPEVEVILVGQRAISLISKTSLIINTTFWAHPGTIGGFQGGGSVARYPQDQLTDTPRSIIICELGQFCSGDKWDYIQNGVNGFNISSNNVNGPGSGNLRINTFVVKTSAKYFPEIQSITTRAQSGQTLDGGFQVHFRGYSTPIIPHDCTSLVLKQILEENLNVAPPKNAPIAPDRLIDGVAGIGLVNVSRSGQDTQEGFTWLITFTTAIGDYEEFTVTSYLKGLQAEVFVRTVQDGNEIKGSFVLDFQGFKTRPIAAYETSDGFRKKLLEIPIVKTAFVSRIDPTQNCDDGLCLYGPGLCRAMIWTVYITSTVDNVTPMSPTSTNYADEAPHYRVTADYSNLLGLEAKVTITYSTKDSPDDEFAMLKVEKPFSLAFGGGGGSYGGVGGRGYGTNPQGELYNERTIKDLLGGSGGSMRSVHPFEINSFLTSVEGKGGHGGGAIELIASNDVTIGTYGRLMMRGLDGEQTSHGGGGGGSGGSILISAGGVILNEGIMDVSGGDGGFGGFEHLDMAGGGGGGGRIAMYAESIVDRGVSNVAGGRCGIYKIPVPTEVIFVDFSTRVEMLTPVNVERIFHLVTLFMNDTVPTIGLGLAFPYSGNTFLSYESALFNGTLQGRLNYTVAMPHNNKFNLTKVVKAINARIGAIYGEIYVLKSIVKKLNISIIMPTKSIEQKSLTGLDCDNKGGDGTYYTEAKMTTSMFVRRTNGAEGTSKALYFSNRETTNTTSGSKREAPFSWNGPILSFESSQPQRVTFYMRIDTVPGESGKSNFGALFSLLSRGVVGLNVSSVIGVFMGYQIMHGANFGSAVDEKFFLKRMVSIGDYPTLDRWYKVDIRINWAKNTYTVSIDDTVVALSQPFTGDDIDGIRISVTRSIDVWFDEIYVGFDNTMDFMCPQTDRKGTITVQPVQKHWNFQEVHGGTSNGYTEYKKMTRHYSHLDTLGSIPFDGQGAVSENQDLKLNFPEGDYPWTQGKLHSGALQYITNSLRSEKTPSGRSSTLVSPNGLWYQVKDGKGGAGDGRQYWYSEHDFQSPLTSTMNGGIAACSSQDLVTWRFEGIVFHYVNISDMIYGTEGPFYAERPKVKFNPLTQMYVIWAVMDNNKRSLAMSLILSSPYEDGPFYFTRSFYPDGNRTRDQVIFVQNGRAVVARTYYQTLEFLLPETVMQPVWESVKDKNGEVNFAASYHRAWYAAGYDNFHDIYLQRWRTEDKPWEVRCTNKLTGESYLRPYGEYTLLDKTVCQDPEEFKTIIGLGKPIIQTKFISPSNANYSWWLQTSVPAVRAQPWASNYRDGYCGIRKLDDDHVVLDPALANFQVENRGDCSNIADNPVHASIQDKLIGVLRVVNTRRAKYMAISELTPDYMDTSGKLNSFEGELESGDLISMIIEMGQFGFGAGDEIKSTFQNPFRIKELKTAVDYNTRFSQYITQFNDRASYSLGCVLDGMCFVNYRDQLTKGNF